MEDFNNKSKNFYDICMETFFLNNSKYTNAELKHNKTIKMNSKDKYYLLQYLTSKVFEIYKDIKFDENDNIIIVDVGNLIHLSNNTLCMGIVEESELDAFYDPVSKKIKFNKYDDLVIKFKNYYITEFKYIKTLLNSNSNKYSNGPNILNTQNTTTHIFFIYNLNENKFYHDTLNVSCVLYDNNKVNTIKKDDDTIEDDTIKAYNVVINKCIGYYEEADDVFAYLSYLYFSNLNYNARILSNDKFKWHDENYSKDMYLIHYNEILKNDGGIRSIKLKCMIDKYENIKDTTDNKIHNLTKMYEHATISDFLFEFNNTIHTLCKMSNSDEQNICIKDNLNKLDWNAFYSKYLNYLVNNINLKIFNVIKIYVSAYKNFLLTRKQTTQTNKQ
jgi:hypothetical protein